jgi:hypothetical protein
MGTFTPVFPKGLVGTINDLEGCVSDLTEAFDNLSIEAAIAPAPAAPVILKKSLRENLFCFDTFHFSVPQSLRGRSPVSSKMLHCTLFHGFDVMKQYGCFDAGISLASPGIG